MATRLAGASRPKPRTRTNATQRSKIASVCPTVRKSSTKGRTNSDCNTPTHTHERFASQALCPHDKVDTALTPREPENRLRRLLAGHDVRVDVWPNLGSCNRNRADLAIYEPIWSRPKSPRVGRIRANSGLDSAKLIDVGRSWLTNEGQICVGFGQIWPGSDQVRPKPLKCGQCRKRSTKFGRLRAKWCQTCCQIRPKSRRPGRTRLGLRWYGDGISKALHWCYAGPPMVLHWHCAGTALATSWSCPGSLLVLHCCYDCVALAPI